MTRNLASFAIALVMVLAVFSPAAATPDEGQHCPGHQDMVKYTGNDTVLPEGTEFCVKGGPQDATGKLVADGVQSVGDYLPGKYDVSYYVIYSSPKPEPEPEPKPEPPQPEPRPEPAPAPLLQRVFAPQPQRYAPSASFDRICGDPVAFIRLNNSQSTMSVRFKVVFVAPNGTRIVKFKTVRAGHEKVIVVRVKGGGSLIRVRGQYLEPLARTPAWSSPDRCNFR